MSWETSDRRSELPSDWANIVTRIKRRDKGRCTWRLPSHARCPRPGTDVDHIRPGDDHGDTNLRLLCPTHHGKKSSREGRKAKADRRALRYRRPEAHPGRVQ